MLGCSGSTVHYKRELLLANGMGSERCLIFVHLGLMSVQDGTLFVFDVKRKDRNVSKRDKDNWISRFPGKQPFFAIKT